MAVGFCDSPRIDTSSLWNTQERLQYDRREQDTRDTLHWYSLIPRSRDPGPGTEITLWDNCPANYIHVCTNYPYTHTSMYAS